MKIKKSNLINILVYIFIAIISNIIIFYDFKNELFSLKILGIVCTIELIMFLFFSYRICKRKINFSMIFILVLYLFNFGQLMIYTFFKGIYSHVRFLHLFANNESLYGFQIINLFFIFICIGCLISESLTCKKDISDKDTHLNKMYDIKKLVDIIILFTFPVKLIIDVLCLIVSITKGGTYARIWLNSFPNVLIYYGKVSLVGFALKIMINKDKPKRQRRIFSFIIIYILIMMISGIRSENVGYVLVYVFIYLFNRKVSIKKNILSITTYAIIALLILTFIVSVGTFRNSTNKSIHSFIDLFRYNFTEKNVLLSLMDTCGDTGYTAQCVINKWLPQYGCSYGASYYLGVFAVIPNIPKIFELPGEITRESFFAIKLQEKGTLSSSYTNIGGSLIGEAFFNFNIIGGMFFACLIGIIVGIVSKKGDIYMRHMNVFGMIRLFPIMFTMIYWVRDYFGGGIREVIWGPIICWGILKINEKNIKIKIN